ncbi:MAG TPA: sensor histidine kinase [Sphingomonas sp.]
MIPKWSMDGVELGDKPGWLADLVVAAIAIAVAVVARVAIEQVVGGVTPFALTFPVVVAATLFSGLRAGSIAAIGCQLLTIFFVFPNWTVEHGGTVTDIANLILSTGSLAVIIWVVASYRTVSRKLRNQCGREVRTLSLMIGEMDHRTKNNFQIAAHLLSEQARTSDNTQVARELSKAAGRLGSIASVYRNLMLVKDRSGRIDLGAYLGDIVALLKDGIVPEEVGIDVSSDTIEVTAHSGMIIGLLVNEWIVNATKYAFPDGRGSIQVAATRSGRALIVTVADDGTCGASGSLSDGSRLVAGLASTINATVSIRRERGTTCVLHVEEA